MGKPNPDIALRIRWRREDQGYTREAFEGKSGVSAKFLYSIEAGKKDFSSQTLIRICQSLQVTSDYILFGKSDADAEFLFLFHQLDEIQKPLAVDLVTALVKHGKSLNETRG